MLCISKIFIYIYLICVCIYIYMINIAGVVDLHANNDNRNFFFDKHI